jgi:capsule biosynthesis phosphatase
MFQKDQNPNQNHYKRFIFDFDDTLSFCTDRDWENAEPDLELIAKINELYAEGFEIWIVTARGQISCNGDITLREQKYRVQIESWLNKYNVHYHNLSFEKVLGAYYVDDKALTIPDFKETSFKIKRGLSGTEVFITDKTVSKTCDNANLIAHWHERAKELQYCVPEVRSVIGKTINFEFITGHQYKPGTIRNKLCDLIDSFRDYEPLFQGSFSTYVKRVEVHLSESELPIAFNDLYLNQLAGIVKFMDENKTFCHGDFTVDNLIIQDRDIFMIDPNPTDYSSWLLDVSKLQQSFRRFQLSGDLAYIQKRYSYHSLDRVLTLLEMSHWIRMLKYVRHSAPDLYERSKQIIFELSKQLYIQL